MRHGYGLDDAVPRGRVRVLDETEGGGQEQEVLHVAAGPGVGVGCRQSQVLVGVNACNKVVYKLFAEFISTNIS